MADDLSNFIEQQKNKLEKERAELTRDGNYNLTSQEREDRRRTPKGADVIPKITEKESPKSISNSNEETGLQLGGYSKHQQKLKEERKQEYIKFLAEKQLRTTGKVDSQVLKEKDVSPITNTINKQKESTERRSYYEQSPRESPPPPPRSRRQGKENLNDINQESYEDILRRKRADERKYRGFDGVDIDDELRQMKLASRNYKSSSRSDGFLQRRYDDDYDDDEFGYGRRSRRRLRNLESKRVRFHDYDDDDDADDRYWSRPRRRLTNDYDDDDDDDILDAIDKLKRQSRREGRRRNSAHEERTLNQRPPLADDTIRRTKTDSEIRSNSAPLPEGAGIIGSHIETREVKLKRQEKYKKELEEQMKMKQENKKKEKIERLGAPGESPGNFMDTDHRQAQYTTPRSSQKPAPIDDPYNLPLGNIGPSSRPQQHPSLYPSPYDDPYYYYGTQERGARTATALQDPLFKSSGYGTTGLHNASDGSVEPSLDPYEQGRQSRRRKADYPEQAVISPRGGHAHQPPGGHSHLGGATAIGQSSPEFEDKQNKRAAMQAYQEELKKQMELREKQKQKEREDKERYDRKIEKEMAQYDPWGKGGAGAPLRDVATGQVIADLRGRNPDNNSGRKSVNQQFNPPPAADDYLVSPRSNYQSPPPQSSYQQPPVQQASGGGQANTSPYGRSDPLKERQPHDDLKEKAKHEYQQYLKQQVEEKERKKKEEQDKIRAEEEKEERRLQEQRERMQREYLEDQEKIKKKEEEAKKQNEALLEAQNAKKREAERKRKEMEDKRQEELRQKLDDEMNAKKAAEGASFRSDSPPIPTMRKQNNDQRGNSPPIPTLANKHNQESSAESAKPSSPAMSTIPTRIQSVTSVRSQNDNDVLSQLTALRQQLRNEEQKVQSQIGQANAVNKYSQISRPDHESRRGKRDVSVFDRALTNKPVGTARKPDSDFSAAEEFNKMKQEDTSSLAGEFRSRFPQPATTDSMLDLQQQEYLREQEDKLSSLRAGRDRPLNPEDIPGPSRSKSKDSLLESESQFIAVDDASEMIVAPQTNQQPRQPSARERRRWKQLEEMAKETKPYDAYKPPTPGGFSLNSVTSFNVDEVASKNEERLRRLEQIRRVGGGSSTKNNPDDVLKQFMNERGRPLTRTSEASLEADTSYEPVMRY